MLASRLPLGEEAPGLLTHIDARWDGRGAPGDRRRGDPADDAHSGEALVAEIYRRLGGLEAMLTVARERAGSRFDPGVCETFQRHADELLDGFDAPSLWDTYLETEPQPRLCVDRSQILEFVLVAADFADNKSGWTVGHSRLVAAVAARAAESPGLSDLDRDLISLAALLHDTGRSAIPNGVWDKPGELTDGETRLARSHSQHTEAILASSSLTRPLSSLSPPGPQLSCSRPGGLW